MKITENTNNETSDVILDESTVQLYNDEIKNAKNFKVMGWVFGGLIFTISIFTYLVIHFTK